MVERAVLTTPHNELTPADFQGQNVPTPPRATEPAELPAPGTMTLEELEEQMIRQSVAHYQGNLSQVARALGLSRGALYRRLEKFGIPFSNEQ
jgi:two-component system NtrC family response regulator